jgi:CHAD domain-containing protein
VGSAEGVHQLRIAVRRLRAALRLFRPLLEPHALAQLETALRRQGQIFGDARDWDVIRLEAFARAADDPVLAPWLPLLVEAVETKRAAAHAAVSAALGERHFTDLVLALSAWVENDSVDPMFLDRSGADEPISTCAPALLDGLARTVAKRGQDVRHSDAGRLHGVRKSLKKLRYGVEFLQDLLRPHRVKTWLKPCRHLLDEFGALNDAAALVRLVDALATGTSPGLAPAVAAVALGARRRQEQARTRVLRLWIEFRAADPPWS